MSRERWSAVDGSIAESLLPRIAGKAEAAFDLVFIDTDKPNNADYLGWALRLSRPGTAIVGANVVREGNVTEAESGDPKVCGTRALFDTLAAEPRLSATAIQTVGDKGWEDFALALVE